MNKRISFIINTTSNEAEYFDLLFESLNRNLTTKEHEIIVFVDNNDNNKITKILNKWKSKFSDLNVIYNPLNIPIGYQRNINILVEKAKYNIVSYLQSDMYICKNYDVNVVKHLVPGVIISGIRIEPPLHPESDDKIIKNFGLIPSEFNFNEFEDFCETIKDCEITNNFWSIPFTLYKDDWLSIGGHDTAFRRSSEDADILNRWTLKNIKFIQSKCAYVYHFSCVSSRGKEWFKKENVSRRLRQEKAQNIELRRLIYKWGEIKGYPKRNIYKYNISASIKNITDNYNLLYDISIFFNKIYVENEDIKTDIVKMLESRDEEDGKIFIPGEMISIDKKIWEDKYKKYFRNIEYFDIIQVGKNNDEIIIEFDMNNLKKKEQVNFIQQINDIIHHSTENNSDYEYDIFKIKVKSKINHIMDNLIVKNPPLDFELIKEKL